MPSFEGFVKLLIDTALTPSEETAERCFGAASDLGSALSELASAWRAVLEKSNSPRVRTRAARNAAMLGACSQRRPELWLAGDARIPRLASDWFAGRDWWWSGPVPAGRRVAVVSSRLPRLFDPHSPWLVALRTALARLREQAAVVVTADRAAGHELLLRGAIRQGSGVIRLHCCDPRGPSPRAWARSWRDCLDQPSQGVVELWCLPLCTRPERCVGPPDESLAAVPERDRATLAWADEVFVLGLRAHGNLHALLRHRLTREQSGVWLVDVPGLQAPQARHELLNLGASLWRPKRQTVPAITNHSRVTDQTCPVGAMASVSASFRSARSPAGSAPAARCAIRDAPFIPLPPADGWDFLTHTTRACIGPWPDQPQDEYLDSLLDARPDADHSPLAALLRIIEQRRLVASSRTIRSGFRVVSFTAVPLAELPQLRVFRSHRGRWDFEPLGLCIRRQWLEARGAQAVLYTGDSDWSRLDDRDRPFFQYVRRLDSTAPPWAPRRPPIDWSLEREWRHVGDVDLSDLPADDALVFVPTAEAAARVASVCPWPVTILPTGAHEKTPLTDTVSRPDPG